MTAVGSTHKDLARALGVSVTTVKSYRRKFPEFPAPTAEGKPLRFPEQTLDVCRRIQDGFRDGLSVRAIRTILNKEFQDIVSIDKESIRDDFQRNKAGQGRPGAASAAAPDRLDEAGEERLRRLAVSLEAALSLRQVDQARLGRLEVLLGDMVGLLNRTHSLHAELLARLDVVADGLLRTGLARAAASPGAAGGVPGGPGPDLVQGAAASGATRPPGEFLDLPVVVLSERGDFLGITNRTGAPFFLRDFEQALISRAAPLGRFTADWRAEGEGWVLSLGGDGEREAHEHRFRRTRTPKGNVTALFKELRISGKIVSEAFLRAFFKQIKDAQE